MQLGVPADGSAWHERCAKASAVQHNYATNSVEAGRESGDGEESHERGRRHTERDGEE